MSPVEYRKSYRQGKAVRWFVRQRMVALEEAGLRVREIARQVGSTRKTVRKWLKRYRAEGWKGLEEKSRRPQRSPNRTPEKEEAKIVELRKRFPWMGGGRMREQLGVARSARTLTRIFRRNGLIRPRRTKAAKKRDLRKVKERLRPFEQVQIDTKHLTDIPELYPFLRKYRLPKYEYTLRDRATGATFMAFGYECTQTNSRVFARYVGRHLSRQGLELNRIQSDNGSEFTGTRKGKTPTGFEREALRWWKECQPIPAGAKTWNSDVEAFHGLVEEELYASEVFPSQQEFLSKAYAYLLYFNYERKNRYRSGYTPMELVKARAEGNRLPEELLNLPPIILDYYQPDFPNSSLVKREKSGYHVCSPDNSASV